MKSKLSLSSLGARGHHTLRGNLLIALILSCSGFISFKYVAVTSPLWDEVNYIGSAAHIRFQNLRDVDCWTPPIAKIFMSGFIPKEADSLLLKAGDATRVQMEGAAIKFWSAVPHAVQIKIFESVRSGQILLWLMSLGLAAILANKLRRSPAMLVPIAFSTSFISLCNVAQLEGMILFLIMAQALAMRSLLNQKATWKLALFGFACGALICTKNSLIPTGIAGLFFMGICLPGSLKVRCSSVVIAGLSAISFVWLTYSTDSFLWTAQELGRTSYMELARPWEATKVGALLLRLAETGIVPASILPQLWAASGNISMPHPVWFNGMLEPQQSLLLSLTFFLAKLAPFDLLILLALPLCIWTAIRNRKVDGFQLFYLLSILLYFLLLQNSTIKMVYRYWMPLLAMSFILFLTAEIKAAKRWQIVMTGAVGVFIFAWQISVFLSPAYFLSYTNPLAAVVGGSKSSPILSEDIGQNAESIKAAIHNKYQDGFFLSYNLAERALHGLVIPAGVCKQRDEFQVATSVVNLFAPFDFLSRAFFSDRFPLQISGGTGLHVSYRCTKFNDFWLARDGKSGSRKGEIENSSTLAVFCPTEVVPKVQFLLANNELVNADSLLSVGIRESIERESSIWLIQIPKDAQIFDLSEVKNKKCLGLVMSKVQD